jgi:hypothetical protein
MLIEWKEGESNMNAAAGCRAPALGGPSPEPGWDLTFQL